MRSIFRSVVGRWRRRFGFSGTGGWGRGSRAPDQEARDQAAGEVRNRDRASGSVGGSRSEGHGVSFLIPGYRSGFLDSRGHGERRAEGRALRTTLARCRVPRETRGRAARSAHECSLVVAQERQAAEQGLALSAERCSLIRMRPKDSRSASRDRLLPPRWSEVFRSAMAECEERSRHSCSVGAEGLLRPCDPIAKTG